MKGFYLFAVAALCLEIMAGCNGDEPRKGDIWDFPCDNMAFRVVDAAGRDLLDPAVEGNILAQPIKVLWQDKEFLWEEDREVSLSSTRAIIPRELGFRHYFSESSGAYWLFFGEFSPVEQWEDATFTIDWGDGTQDVVQFDCYITWKKHDPTVHKHLSVNGIPNEARYPYDVVLVK